MHLKTNYNILNLNSIIKHLNITKDLIKFWINWLENLEGICEYFY